MTAPLNNRTTHHIAKGTAMPRQGITNVLLNMSNPAVNPSAVRGSQGVHWGTDVLFRGTLTAAIRPEMSGVAARVVANFNSASNPIGG